MTVFCLDFDGVLCDSAGETGATGWLAAARLWPERFSGPPPITFLTAFRQVRPVIETGYESILLARLLCDGVSTAQVLSEFRRLAGELQAAEHLTRERLVGLFGGVRDQAIREDFRTWLGRHEFYPGTVAAVNAAIAGGHLVVISTTKEKRFTSALVEHAGLGVPPSQIYSLEDGPKAAVLKRLQAAHPDAALWFVEDRLTTLRELGADPELAAIALCLARWGYCTAAELAAAELLPRLRRLDLAAFCALLAHAPG